jgi:hypothetical protein
MLERNPDWKAVVHPDSPYDVRSFITKKCGPVTDNCEGRKVSKATNSRMYSCIAISIRAALTFFYKSLRPDESVLEWHIDHVSGTWQVIHCFDMIFF